MELQEKEAEKREPTVKRCLLILDLKPLRNGDRKIMQSIRITSRPTPRKRKWNQLSQF